jgi:hypothetical protein
MWYRGLLLRNHLHRVFLIDGDHHMGSSKWCRSRGWRNSNRGCGGISSVIIILILGIISYVVSSSLLGDLRDELIMRLDHSL